MSTDQVTITQIVFNAAYPAATAYGYKGNGVPAPLEGLGTLDIDDLTGGAFNLWATAADNVYVGCTSPFAYVGFKMHTAGSYGLTLPIVTSTLDHIFIVLTDVTSRFKSGFRFYLHGSAGAVNDGWYTCSGDSTYVYPHTTITVTETIPGDTDTGHIEQQALWYGITQAADIPIHEANTPSTIILLTDLTAKFKAGYQFTIHGSTANDGIYTCTLDSTYDVGTTHTIITVGGLLIDGTNDGHIQNNSIWAPLTAVGNTTAGFTQSGFIAFVIPSDWGLNKLGAIDNGTGGTSAYWIKANVATYTTTAKAYHLLRNVTLQAPLIVEPRWNEGVSPDFNGANRLMDKTYLGPPRATIDCTQLATGPQAVAMPNLTILWDMLNYRCRLVLSDLAYTSPIGTSAFSTDSYVYEYRGHLVGIGPMSPSKMHCHEYTLEFMLDAISTISNRLGLP